MALTTQCPYCKTAFRVASDQLKLRDGLVRCGACQEIFDGKSHLLADSDPARIVIADEAPAALPADAETTETHDHSIVHDPVSDSLASASYTGDAPETKPALAQDSRFAPTESDDADSTALTPSESPAEPGPGATSNQTQASTNADAPEIADEKESSIGVTTGPDITSAILLKARAELTPMMAMPTKEAADIVPPARREAKPRTPAVPLPDPDEPEFVAHARRTEKRGRVMHIGLWAGSALLFLSLLMQAAYSFRNVLAETYPQTRTLLQATCKTLGCRIELLKQIDAVAIEAIELQQSTAHKDRLILTSLLRNRSTLPQAWPNIELSLNDANEKVIIRRVFTASDYLAQPQDAAKGFAANSEQALKLVFDVSDVKPAGFRVYLFYP